MAIFFISPYLSDMLQIKLLGLDARFSRLPSTPGATTDAKRITRTKSVPRSGSRPPATRAAMPDAARPLLQVIARTLPSAARNTAKAIELAGIFIYWRAPNTDRLKGHDSSEATAGGHRYPQRRGNPAAVYAATGPRVSG